MCVVFVQVRERDWKIVCKSRAPRNMITFFIYIYNSPRDTARECISSTISTAHFRPIWWCECACCCWAVTTTTRLDWRLAHTRQTHHTPHHTTYIYIYIRWYGCCCYCCGVAPALSAPKCPSGNPGPIGDVRLRRRRRKVTWMSQGTCVCAECTRIWYVASKLECVVLHRRLDLV